MKAAKNIQKISFKLQGDDVTTKPVMVRNLYNEFNTWRANSMKENDYFIFTQFLSSQSFYAVPAQNILWTATSAANEVFISVSLSVPNINLRITEVIFNGAPTFKQYNDGTTTSFSVVCSSSEYLQLTGLWFRSF